ncbi:MAG: hypothetical protein ACRC2S_00440 [Waterburya sp.]
MSVDFKKELEEKESLIKTKDTNKIIIIFFVLGISILISTVINLGFIYLALQLGTREKIFVTRQGETEIAEEKDPHYRTEQAIKETVSDFLYLTHEWHSEIPGSYAKDPGVQLKGEQNKYFRVPTTTYTASYLLEVGFRKKFLEELSQSIPSTFYHGKFSSHVKIYFIGNTERIDNNLYRVEVVMTRTDIDANAELEEIEIHQIIYLQATEPYRLVLGNQEPSMFRKQLNKLLKNGLIIYKISPLIAQQ